MLQRVMARLSVENFFSHSGEKFRRGNFLCCCFSYILVAKRYMDKTTGIIKNSFENFCPTMPKIFVVEPFCPSLFSGIEKVYASEGYVTIFRRKFFVSQSRKNFVGEPFGPSLMWGIEKIYASEGYVTIFRRKFLVSQYRNIL